MNTARAAFGSQLRAPRRRGPWPWAALGVAVIAGIPIAAVLVLAAAPSDGIWSHLLSTVLPTYVGTTLVLMVGVGIGTVVIGTGTAWLVTMTRFPGRKIFEWSLLLPLAVPAYVIAFVYTDLLEYAGPVQTTIRDIFGWTSARNYTFPEIRSLGGAIAMMTLVLYPYVYLLSRAAFLEQSVCVLEVSRTLGRGPWRNFFTVAVPLARPAIVVGVSLALMETLNDFGTVDFFAVQTMTRGVFDVWLNMNSVSGAAQIASCMLAFVALLIFAERFGRRRQRFHHTTSKYREISPRSLSRGRATLAFLACAAPLVLGFILPAYLLSGLAFGHGGFEVGDWFLASAGNSLMLSSIAAVIAVGVAVFLVYANRLSGDPLINGATRFASLGYAVPGAVLAIGVLVPFAAFDNAVDAFLTETFGFGTGLILSGTVIALIFGYVVRFLALAVGAVDASLARISPSIDGAARTLGHGAGATLTKVHLPLMRGSLFTAAILVFVDGMKELPMTVIMRPFNFETLATQVHQFAGAEQFAEAAPAALAIVVTGVLPVIVMSFAIASSRPGAKTAHTAVGEA